MNAMYSLYERSVPDFFSLLSASKISEALTTDNRSRAELIRVVAHKARENVLRETVVDS